MIDTHELTRRAGSQREVSFTAPAPADLGIDVIGVPEGDPIQFDLRLESVVEGVLVTGTARGRLVGECARCLVDIEDEFLADVQELYVYPESEAEPDEASRMEGDLIDLEPVLRDQVVLALPFQPLCTDDCPGLCPECGVRLADEPGHSTRTVSIPAGPPSAACSSRTNDRRTTRYRARVIQTHTSRPGPPAPGRTEES